MSDEKIGYYAPSVWLPRCNTPAPVASNGAWLIACQEPRDHDGPHRLALSWTYDNGVQMSVTALEVAADPTHPAAL